MKKLILITGILLSTSLWANPMDKVCSIHIDKDEGTDSFWGIADFIGENCERNNILNFYGFSDEKIFNLMDEGEEPYYLAIPFSSLIKSWCRFDRNVIDEISRYRDINCVLYSNQSREFISN
jgi:hypothetical protein